MSNEELISDFIHGRGEFSKEVLDNIENGIDEQGFGDDLR